MYQPGVLHSWLACNGALVLGATLVYILIFTFRKHGLSLVRALSVLCMIIAVFLAFVQIWEGQ